MEPYFPAICSFQQQVYHVYLSLSRVLSPLFKQMDLFALQILKPPILPDLVNQVWFLLIILIFYYYNLVRLKLFVFLSLTAFLPFLINDIIFPISYMPDQYKYFIWAHNLRYLTPESSQWTTMTIAGFEFTRPEAKYFTTVIFSYFPIPFINSVTSISIINRIIYTVIIILSVHYKIQLFHTRTHCHL